MPKAVAQPLAGAMGMATRDAAVVVVMTDAAMATSPPVPAMPSVANDDDDAGMRDASAGVDQPADSGTTGATATTNCGRDELQRRADAFLLAMSNRSARSLDLDSDVRYTENGEVVALGNGLWRSAPKRVYARHFLDAARCSSLSVAVLNDSVSSIVYAMRLNYLDGRLLEVETVFVRPTGRWFNPDGIIPAGSDPWLEPVDVSVRMSRDALVSLAEHYFASVTDASLLPPHAPNCMVLQNGTPAGLSCGDVPSNERYKQLRYLVVDESVGIVTTVARRRAVLSMYVFKAQGDTIQNIEAIGGMYTEKSGW